MLLSPEPQDQEILRAIRLWIDDLARGDFNMAYSRTDHDPYYKWTPDQIRAHIGGYGDPAPHPSGVTFRVTEIADATGGPPHFAVDRVGVPSGAMAYITHDLPLNGEWSELAASFRLEQRGQGTKLVLEEIHVF